MHQGDFVLQLTEGVTEPEQTLRDYVVTPQLVDAFSNALGFIQQAVQTGGSKAAYLHGSFGSGKSHFMAVLNLLLAGNTQARSIPELADVVARHSWTHGRKFLLVPYHMIGARDMESAILGQYAEYVRKLHPEAPVPGFYLAEGLFKDARELRERMGDEAFFAQLNKGVGGAGGGGGGWGELDSGWDAASFEAAMLEPPNGDERSRLVGDLITQFFSAYRSLAGSGESFVSLDDGLSIMSRHAQALGYDAVILFLDELILWLASHAADVNFVSREGTKLAKLVEATNADRPDSAGQLRRPAARPARPGGREPRRLGAAAVQRRAEALGGALPPHHAGGPQPAGDRREARAAPGGRGRAPDAADARSTT